jgi:predicted outer membrane repeat protein
MPSGRTHVLGQWTLLLVGAQLLLSTPVLARPRVEQPVKKGRVMVATCDIQVAAGGTALADAIEQAPAGARLCLAPGEHVAGVALVRSITIVGLQGADKTVLQGPGRLPVLRIEDDGLAVRIQGVTLQGGESDAGGGLSIRGRGKVQVVECRFTGNRAGLVGGGGLYATSGLLTVERTRFDHNHGRQGGGLFLDAVVHAELTRCEFDANEADLGGGARITEGVQADFKAGTFHDNRAGGLANALHVSGTHSRIPHVTLDHTAVQDGALVNGPDVPGSIRLKACRVPAAWRGIPGVVDTGGTIYATP